MSSSESHSAMNVPQYDHRTARDRTRPRQSAHASHHRHGAPSHLARLLCLPQHRRGGDASCKLPPAKEVVHPKTPARSPESRAMVYRMPPELLGIIFEGCLDKQATSGAALSQLPLLLGRVCGYWRSVAQKTPRLWTSLSLRFLETHVDRSHDGVKVATAVEIWLRRSHPLPLSIAFTDNRIFQKDTEDIVIWLLTCIRMHAPRWKAIHLKFSSDYFLQMNTLSSCAFSSLTSFSLQIDHMGWRRSLLPLHFDLTQASRLTSLAYTGPDHVAREDIFVDWTHLTSVEFSYNLHEAGGESTTFPRHFSVLALCRNLTELSIGLSTTRGHHLNQFDAIAQGQTTIPTIELPGLHTLRVRRLSRTAHACALIDALRLPQLSTLYIDSAVLMSWDDPYTQLSHPDLHSPAQQMHTQTHWWHARHFSALLDRSGCHLQTLDIQDVDMSPLELARLLRSPCTSPTLSTFTFEPCPRTYPLSDVLAYLVCAPSSGSTTASAPSPSPSPGLDAASSSGLCSPSFPSLTHLRLGCAHETHLHPIADLIESRTGDRASQAGVQPLAVFELIFHDLVYSHSQGGGGRGRGRGQQHQPSRKVCFEAFRERVLRCAREGGVDVDIRVERPYEPMYIPVP